MNFNLDNLLNLPNVTVFSYSIELEFIILNLHLIDEGITCPHCHNYTDTVHQTRTKLVRDLSIFGRLVYQGKRILTSTQNMLQLHRANFPYSLL
jgi:transposase